jgi:hypothetical protein
MKHVTVQRYHVRVGQQRTTVSMDTIVAEYLSLWLEVAPSNPKSHSAVRAWMQAEIGRNGNPDQKHVSQWLLGQALKAIVAEHLRHRHSRWCHRISAARPRSAALIRRRKASRRATARGQRPSVDAKSAIGGPLGDASRARQGSSKHFKLVAEPKTP